MKLFLFFLIIFYGTDCYSQSKLSQPEYRNKIGIGVYKFNRIEYLISGSFTRINRRKNELTFPVYIAKDGMIKDVSASVAYNWSTIKRNSRFNFYFGPEINIDYSWYHRSDVYVSRYGYFLCIDLSPSLRIYKRFSLAFQFKLGYGYLWATNDREVFQNLVFYTDRGWYVRWLPSFNLYYKF
jgi:hypothetical protein